MSETQIEKAQADEIQPADVAVALATYEAEMPPTQEPAYEARVAKWQQFFQEILANSSLDVMAKEKLFATMIARLEQLATRDALTGFYNRGEFDRQLVREIAEAERSGKPLFLIIVDLDNLKELNSAKGHSTGSKALEQVAETIRVNLGDCSLAFRYGGDEFAVLLPTLNLEEAEEIVRKIVEHVRNLTIEGIGLTVTAGVGALGAHESSEDFFRRVDEFLLEAKRKGKNRYVVAE